QAWLLCNRVISIYPADTIATSPVANPSSPSVRFTALVVAVVIRLDHRTKSIAPIIALAKSKYNEVSRNNELDVEAGVSPWSFGKFKARTANATPTAPWPTILPVGVSPRDRWLENFM